MVEVEQLFELFSYDPSSGEIRWIVDRGSNKVKGKIAGKTNSTKRRQLRVLGTIHTATRVIWAMMTGRWPDKEIDHINGDGLDNRWVNLREVTHQENMKNKGLYKSSKTKLKGVFKRSPSSKWTAKITCEKRQINLGSFDSKEGAAAAYNEAAIDLFGTFNRVENMNG